MPNCGKCLDTGVIETGNNDLPCDCPAGYLALFNVTNVVGPVTGVEIKRHFLNISSEPLALGPEPILASNLPGREETPLQESSNPLDKFAVVVQLWEESERGWGTRPDQTDTLYILMRKQERHISKIIGSVCPIRFQMNIRDRLVTLI